jgi:transcriptional regulator with XRE-family HTH domain
MKSNCKNIEILIILGQNLKRIRESKHISQAELGLMIDSYQSTIIRIEKARMNSSISLLVSIAEALNVELSELLDFDTSCKNKD